MLYFHKTPMFVQKVFSGLEWKGASESKKIYLTFDDGPIPEITPWILDVLKDHNAKATFFCVGENVKNHPGIFSRIINAGHSVGNHTYNHINGFNHSPEQYLDNVSKCDELIQSNLFRPPYGKMTCRQYALLKKKYRIIMWDVLSGDFDSSISASDCLEATRKNIRPGSIVVLHDNLKAIHKLKSFLPSLMDYFSSNGFCLEGL